MTLANQISILRMLLAPGVVAALLYYSPTRDYLRFVAFGLFFIGIASDALDGFIARTQRQQSELGTLLDPIADKLLILGTMISLSVIHGLPEWLRIPAWFNLVVISRDVLLLTGTAVLFLTTGKWSVRPSPLGKWTTATQMVVIVVVLLGLPMRQPLLVVVALLTVASGIQYIRLGSRALS